MSAVPVVSVVIPAFNSAPFIERTLMSVVAQTEPPDEIVVSDDGSTDETIQVVERFLARIVGIRFKVLRNAHAGPGAARNAGIRAAGGEWIAFLDSDDLWEDRKLAVMRAAIRAQPTANFFCHDETIVLLNGGRLVSDRGAEFQASEEVPRQLYVRNSFSTSAVVCRRNLLLAWGGFEESLSSAQDYELWLRMSPDLKPAIVRENLGSYVMRAGNITTSRHWRRLRNELQVKYWHREKAGLAVFLRCSLRLAVSYVLAPLRRTRS